MDSNLERNIEVFLKNSISAITCTYWQAMINVRQQALQNTQKAQCRQNVYYDAAHNINKGQYKVGAVVLLRNSKKLTNRVLKWNQTG